MSADVNNNDPNHSDQDTAVTTNQNKSDSNNNSNNNNSNNKSNNNSKNKRRRNRQKQKKRKQTNIDSFLNTKSNSTNNNNKNNNESNDNSNTDDCNVSERLTDWEVKINEDLLDIDSSDSENSINLNTISKSKDNNINNNENNNNSNKNNKKNNNNNNSKDKNNLKKKNNLDKSTLNWDFASESWYDTNDKYYTIKKSINNIGSHMRTNFRDCPQIIFQNVQNMDCSWNDVHMALDDFFDSMVRLGNLEWNMIKTDDILDYKIYTIKKKSNNNNNENKEEQKSVSSDTEMDCKTIAKDNNDNNDNNNNEDKDNNNNSDTDSEKSESKFNKPQKHSPKILPIGKRVSVPSSLYTQYELVKEKDIETWVRNTEKKYNDNYEMSTITIVLSPNCELIKKYPGNWTKILMNKFDQYTVNDFSEYNSQDKNNNLELNLAFIEPLCYYHIYFNAPHQILTGSNWNEKIATFFYQSFNRMNIHPFDYRDILAVKKWGNKFKGRVSCYIKGHKPPYLPKHISIRRAKRIKLRVYQDEINETQKRALEISKCYACFQYGHNVIQCPTAQKERSKYIKEIVKRINISQQKRKELIKNWRFKPKLCSNCGHKKHDQENCPNKAYCIVCEEYGHKSGKKSLECKKLITLAKATLRFDSQFKKCCVANHIIPPLPMNGEGYKLNIPWVFNKQWNPISNNWYTIDGWRQKWDENCNLEDNDNGMEIEIEKVEEKENGNGKKEIEDPQQPNNESYYDKVKQQLDNFKNECKQELERLQLDLANKKRNHAQSVEEMKVEYNQIKKHVESRRARVDKLKVKEKELVARCDNLSQRVNKMNSKLNKNNKNNKNKNKQKNTQQESKNRESEHQYDSSSSSGSDSSRSSNSSGLSELFNDGARDEQQVVNKVVAESNINLNSTGKIKDKDKR